RRPRPSLPETGRGRRLTYHQPGELTVHHAPQSRGRAHIAAVQVPKPQFSHSASVPCQPSFAEPLPVPRDQPEPSAVVPPARSEQLRWARCPDDDRLHLVRPGDVPL